MSLAACQILQGAVELFGEDHAVWKSLHPCLDPGVNPLCKHVYQHLSVGWNADGNDLVWKWFRMEMCQSWNGSKSNCTPIVLDNHIFQFTMLLIIWEPLTFMWLNVTTPISYFRVSAVILDDMQMVLHFRWNVLWQHYYEHQSCLTLSG